MRVLSLAAGLSSFLSIGFFAAFLSNWSVSPKTIDRGGPWLAILTNPYGNNAVLFTIFAVHHSVLLHPRIRSLIESVLPNRMFGPFYAISASLIVALMCLGWAPIAGTVWSLNGYSLLYTLVWVLNILCWIMLSYSVLASDPMGSPLTGIVAKLLRLRKQKFEKGVLLTNGMYSYVRHPLMTFMMLSTWIHPHMSLGHFLFCLASTVYILVAVAYSEEPKLVKEFGVQYKLYMKRVPRCGYISMSSFISYFASFLGYIAFGLLIPFISNWPYALVTVDGSGPMFTISSNPYIQNILLFALFFLQHSGLAVKRVREGIKSSTPKGTFENLYNMSSAVVIILTCIGWCPISTVVWSVSHIPSLHYFITGLNLLCWLGLTVTVLLTAPIDNRLTELLRSYIFPNKTIKTGQLITTGLYSVCRHPMVTVYCLALIVHPHMSVGHFLFTLLTVLYAVIAVVFLEEPKLIKEFGSQYMHYMNRVPRFFPGIWVL